MKNYLIATALTAAAYIAAALGGWDAGLQTLVLFMGIDYVSGLAVAGFYKKSKHSVTGGLSSKCGFFGLAKKGMVLLIVLIAYRLDIVIGTDFARAGVIIAFIANELISILENASLMGIPIPAKLQKALDVINAEGHGSKK